MRLVNLSDGDRLAVHDDRPDSWITGDRIAVLMHGLCGSHASPYLARIAARLRRLGVRTVRVDFRGCGSSQWYSRHHLHAGCSRDVADVVDWLHEISPLSQISLIGFSLGAAITLKTLGEWGVNAPDQVDSAIAVAPPIDLARCCGQLRKFGNRIYDYYFTHQLKRHLQWRRQHIAGLVDNGLKQLPDRLVHFDDQFTADVWGFDGARDYYEKCSAAPLLPRIAVPTIILTSRDDPVVPFDMFAEHDRSEWVDLVSTPRGGHLGFLAGRTRDPDRYWMDWRICDWIGQLDA